MVAALTSKEPASYHRVELEMAVALHRIDQNRDKRLKPLAADAIARLPQHRQRLTYRLIVKSLRVDAGFAAPMVDSARAARVCDDSRSPVRTRTGSVVAPAASSPLDTVL